MPELPDLQVISRNLDKLFSGQTLTALAVEDPRKKSQEPAWKKALVGHVLRKVYREGKELRLAFAGGGLLGVHLMLHGQFRRFGEQQLPPHTLLALWFGESQGLALTDFQQRASATLDPPQPEAPDALSITPHMLSQVLADSRARIKNLLLDQHVLRGIGNAYADEILWEARISPFSQANKIPPAAVKALADAIPGVLKQAEKEILHQAPDLIAGELRDFMKIHNPKKKTSPTGKPIHHKAAAGRKTYYTEEQELYA